MISHDFYWFPWISEVPRLPRHWSFRLFSDGIRAPLALILRCKLCKLCKHANLSQFVPMTYPRHPPTLQQARPEWTKRQRILKRRQDSWNDSWNDINEMRWCQVLPSHMALFGRPAVHILDLPSVWTKLVMQLRLWRGLLWSALFVSTSI